MTIKVRLIAWPLIIVSSIACLIWLYSLLVRVGVKLDLKYEVQEPPILHAKDDWWWTVQQLSGWTMLATAAVLAFVFGHRWFISPSKS